MRCWALLVGTWLGMSMPMFAQEPAVLLEGDPAFHSSPTVYDRLPAVEDRRDDTPGRWTADFLLGLPTGLRLQRALDDGAAWRFEGLIGFESLFPVAGLGLRRRFIPWDGKHDDFVLAPGADVYVLYNWLHSSGGPLGGGPGGWTLAAGDVDFIWAHDFNGRCAGELGVKLGAAANLAANTTVPVLPVVSLFGGFQF